MKTGLLCAAIATAAPRVARADCEGPRPDIVWTYPDESTASVPPNAVFWAVAHVGEVSAEVDGVPLTPLARDGLGRHQFSPPEDLSEGTHELVVRPDSGELGAAAAPERRISFSVEAQPAAGGDVSVSSVTVYPLAYGAGGRDLINPPPHEYDVECSQLAIPLEWSCDDIIPSTLARVAYEADGAPLAYVVQGNVLVPQGCASFWTSASLESDAATFRAAALLPTGLTEENAFTGTIEERTLQDSYPDRFGGPSSACSLRASSAPRGDTFGTTLLLLAACGSRRVMRRSRARA